MESTQDINSSKIKGDTDASLYNNRVYKRQLQPINKQNILPSQVEPQIIGASSEFNTEINTNQGTNIVTSAQLFPEIPSRSIINASSETNNNLNQIISASPETNNNLNQIINSLSETNNLNQIINASPETNNNVNQIINDSSETKTAEGLIIGLSSEFNFNNIISQRTGTNLPKTADIGELKQSLIDASSEFNTEFDKFSEIQTQHISSIHSARYSQTEQFTPTQAIFGDIPDIEMIFSLNNDEISATDPDSSESLELEKDTVIKNSILKLNQINLILNEIRSNESPVTLSTPCVPGENSCVYRNGVSPNFYSCDSNSINNFDSCKIGTFCSSSNKGKINCLPFNLTLASNGYVSKNNSNILNLLKSNCTISNISNCTNIPLLPLGINLNQQKNDKNSDTNSSPSNLKVAKDLNSTDSSAIDFFNLNNSMIVDQNIKLSTSGTDELVADSAVTSKAQILDSQQGLLYTPTLNFKNVQDQSSLNVIPKNEYLAYTTSKDDYYNNVLPIYSSGKVIPTSISVLPTSLQSTMNGYYAGVMPTFTGYSRVYPIPSFSDNILQTSENTLSLNSVLPTTLPSSSVSVTPTSFSVLPTSEAISNLPTIQTSHTNIISNLYYANIPAPTSATNNIYYSNAPLFTSIIPNLYYSGSIPSNYFSTPINNPNLSLPPQMISVLPTSIPISNNPIPSLSTMPIIPSVSSEIQNLAIPSLQQNIPTEISPIPAPTDSTVTLTFTPTITISNTLQNSISVLPISASEVNQPLIPNTPPKEQTTLSDSTDSTITITSTPTITLTNTIVNTSSLNLAVAPESIAPSPTLQISPQTSTLLSIDSLLTTLSSNPTISLPIELITSPTIRYYPYVSPTSIVVNSYKAIPPMYGYMNTPVIKTSNFSSDISVLPTSIIPTTPIAIAPPTPAPIDPPALDTPTVLPIISISDTPSVLPTSIIPTTPIAIAPPTPAPIDPPALPTPTILPITSISDTPSVLPTSIIPTTPIAIAPPTPAPIDPPALPTPTVLPVTSISDTPSVLPTSIIPTTPIPIAPPTPAPIDPPALDTPTVLPITSISDTPSVLPTSIIPTTPIAIAPPTPAPIDPPALPTPTVLPVTSISDTPSVLPTSIIPTTPIPIAPPTPAPIDPPALDTPTVLPITSISDTPSVLPTSIIPTTPIPIAPPTPAPVDPPALATPTVLPITTTPVEPSTISSAPPIETPLVTQILPTTLETIPGYSGTIYVEPTQVSYINILPTIVTQTTVSTPNCAAKYLGGSLDPICITSSSISVLPTSSSTPISRSYPVYVQPTSQNNYISSINYVFSFSTSILPTTASISYNTVIQYNNVNTSSDSAKTCNPREYKCLVADGEGTLYNFCDDSQILRLYQCPFGTRCYSPKPGNRNVDCLPISQDPNQYYSNQNQSTTTTITGSFDNSSGILTNLNIGSTFSESASIVSNVQDSINSSIQSETNISTSTINTVPSNGITISASSSATTQGVVNAAIPDSTSNNVVTSSSGQIELNGIVLSSSMLAPGVIADKEILVTPKVKLVPTIG
ncbi:hypothetical protein AYI69_g1416 [Smittium culicis]|uniref:Uncharacterized protein n=1 Tax=Smittium culicis TaxID=133412 RepID=A0A1R1YQB2_9FUNG|nr:hypothetical protein AYI69_g1416 [Smittium culicis]